MNVLIYDESRTLARLARSLLLGLHHRVSISCEPAEAELKISTALFDAIIIGPAGAPRSLADLIDRDFAHLSVVLIGLNSEFSATPRIAAALRSPLSAVQFTTAVHRVQRKIDLGSRLPEVAVEISDEDVRVLCKATRLSRTAMMLEGIAPPVEGVADEFSQFFGPREDGHIVAAFHFGESTFRVPGAVAFAERSPARDVRLVGVRFEEQLAEPVLAGLGLVA